MRGAISSPQRPKSRIEIRSATRRANSSSSSPDDQPLRVPRIRPSSRSSSTLRRTSPSSGLSATTVRTNSMASSTRDPPNGGCACLNSSSLTSAAVRSCCRSSWKASAAIGVAWPTYPPSDHVSKSGWSRGAKSGCSSRIRASAALALGAVEWRSIHTRALKVSYARTSSPPAPCEPRAASATTRSTVDPADDGSPAASNSKTSCLSW